MEFKNNALDIRFTVADSLTVRQQLQFKGRISAGRMLSDDIYVRFWNAAVPLIEDWTGVEENGNGYKESSTLPDPAAVDLDTETDPKVAEIMFWVGNQVAGHMNNLDVTDPNS